MWIWIINPHTQFLVGIRLELVVDTDFIGPRWQGNGVRAIYPSGGGVDRRDRVSLNTLIHPLRVNRNALQANVSCILGGVSAFLIKVDMTVDRVAPIVWPRRLNRILLLKRIR